MACVSCLATILIACGSIYQWPLDLPRELTSSFAEYRPGRFHAGIDLRTGGIGKAVHAAGDGHISRVRCSPWGYGKAVYLQLADGKSVVYAHLDDYSEALRAFVRAEQHKAKSYSVDLYLKPHQFPVKKGDVIAKSGQTGIGAPHLHYEFRDEGQHPVNPRLLDISWPDTIAPRLKQLLAVPGDASSTINGDIVPLSLPLKRGEEGVYYAPVLRVKGKIGLALDLVDEHKGSRLGPYSMRLIDAGQELFRVQHDQLSYDNHRNAAVAYHPFFKGEGRFLTLWRWPGNVCQSYAHSAGEGWVQVPDTPRPLTIEVADFMGNTARLIVRLEADAPVTPPAQPGEAASGAVDMECFGAFLVITARFDSTESAAPQLQIEGGGSQPFQRVGQRTFRHRFSPVKSGRYTFSVSHPRLPEWRREVCALLRGSGEKKLSLGEVEASVPDDAPYGVLFLRAWPLAETPRAPLPKLGQGYRVWPDASPIDAPITLSFPVPAGAKDVARVQIYRYRGSYWASEETRHNGNRLEIETRDLGTFAVLEDDAPPKLNLETPPEGYRAQTRRPILRATVSEIGSGIASITGYCGTQWLLLAYDPERNSIDWERDEDLPAGKQTLSLRVADEAGNETAIERTIILPGASVQ